MQKYRNKQLSTFHAMQNDDPCYKDTHAPPSKSRPSAFKYLIQDLGIPFQWGSQLERSGAV